MSNPSLMNRATALMRRHAKQAGGLALVPLAAAPAAAQITFSPDPGTLDASGVSPFASSTVTTGDPLATVGGTNGSDAVSLAGGAGVNNAANLSSASIAFVNLGTITADAGDSVRVDYDFTQSFASSSGGSSADFDFELSLEVAGVEVSDLDSGSLVGIPDSPLLVVPQSGQFETAVFSTDLVDAPLRFRLTATATSTGGGLLPPLSNFVVTVPGTSPGNALTLTVVPEPAGALLLGTLSGTALVRRRRGPGRGSP